MRGMHVAHPLLLLPQALDPPLPLLVLALLLPCPPLRDRRLTELLPMDSPTH